MPTKLSVKTCRDQKALWKWLVVMVGVSNAAQSYGSTPARHSEDKPRMKKKPQPPFEPEVVGFSNVR
jgi:hypothetical protein